MFPQEPRAVSVTSKDVPGTAFGVAVIPRRLAGARRRTILLPEASVNQMFPSGPTVRPWGLLFRVGALYSVSKTPSVVICPIAFPPHSVNQRFPSGPVLMVRGQRGE